MIKFIIIIVILALVAGALYYYYKTKEEKFSMYDRRVLFKAYAHSLDGLPVVPLRRDPENLVEDKRVTKGIPEDFFQESVADKEELSIIGSMEVMSLTGESYQFYLAKTQGGKFGYIANYRLEEKNGKPFAPLPPKGPID
jgi:hypothetical protein